MPAVTIKVTDASGAVAQRSQNLTILRASDIFRAANFTGAALDTVLGVARAESGRYVDAVGDILLCRRGPFMRQDDAVAVDSAGVAAGSWTNTQYDVFFEWGAWWLRNPKWGCSVGLTQIRTLRDPTAYSAIDRWRDAEKLKDPYYQGAATWALSKGGTDFTPWSVFVHGTYEPYVGVDYYVWVGHSEAAKWNY